MKLKGIFGVPAIATETGKEYIQPIPNVVVVLRTDEGIEHTFEVDSFGRIIIVEVLLHKKKNLYTSQQNIDNLL